MTVPTPTELRTTLVTVVAGATGTPPSKWEKLIGEIEMLSLAFHPRCNWRVTVSGAGEEREVFDAAIELLQREHPYVASEKGPGR